MRKYFENIKAKDLLEKIFQSEGVGKNHEIEVDGKYYSVILDEEQDQRDISEVMLETTDGTIVALEFVFYEGGQIEMFERIVGRLKDNNYYPLGYDSALPRKEPNPNLIAKDRFSEGYDKGLAKGKELGYNTALAEAESRLGMPIEKAVEVIGECKRLDGSHH